MRGQSTLSMPLRDRLGGATKPRTKELCKMSAYIQAARPTKIDLVPVGNQQEGREQARRLVRILVGQVDAHTCDATREYLGRVFCLFAERRKNGYKPSAELDFWAGDTDDWLPEWDDDE